MKKKRTLSLALLLLIPLVALGQTARSSNATADRGWQQFWRQFTAAVNKKDRKALKSMMSTTFRDAGAPIGDPRDAWIKGIDEGNLWPQVQRSVALGTVSYKLEERPARVTRNKDLIFEYGKDGKWRFWGIMGD